MGQHDAVVLIQYGVYALLSQCISPTPSARLDTNSFSRARKPTNMSGALRLHEKSIPTVSGKNKKKSQKKKEKNKEKKFSSPLFLTTQRRKMSRQGKPWDGRVLPKDPVTGLRVRGPVHVEMYSAVSNLY